MYASSAVNGDDNQLRLFTGRAHPGLGKEIANILGVALGKIQISSFSDTETWVQVEESVRESDVFILQPTGPPVNDNLMELLVMLDAFKRASAASVTTVIPYFGYAKQDRKSTGREPISARMVADILIRAGADRVISIDLHVAQIQGFFAIPMDHLTALTTLVKYLRGKDLSNAVVVAPDVGRAKFAEKYAGLLDLPMALMHKRPARPQRNGAGGGRAGRRCARQNADHRGRHDLNGRHHLQLGESADGGRLQPMLHRGDAWRSGRQRAGKPKP